MKILIAEDDTSSLIISRRTVEKLGHECLAARDGEEAWRLYLANPVDVILSDLMMPGLDGLELCRRVRERAREPYTYFIFLTAMSDRDHYLDGMKIGADDYLSKPLKRLDLEAGLIAGKRVTTLHRTLMEQKAELARLNRKLFEQARTDPMTGLGNRLRLEEDLEALGARVTRHHHCYCVGLCDVDDFKQYNDRYGHLPGNDVLRAVADAIAGGLRTSDTAYRYGGEEFLVILPEQTLESSAIAIDRIRRSIEDLAIPFEEDTPYGVVTISAGVACLPAGDEKSLDALLREADAALYSAKRAGKNRTALHEG